MIDFDTPEDEIAWLRSKLDETRAEKDDALNLVDQMRESTQEQAETLEAWIDVFDMDQDERGVWIFKSGALLADEYQALLKEYKTLVADWNKFVPRYNATIDPQPAGRPLEASDAQVKTVKAHRKRGVSLRGIAAETGLSLRTVRTITDADAGKGRTAKKNDKLRRKEFGRARAAAFRERKRRLDDLPKRIDQLTKDHARNLKAAKGLIKS